MMILTRTFCPLLLCILFISKVNYVSSKHIKNNLRFKESDTKPTRSLLQEPETLVNIAGIGVASQSCERSKVPSPASNAIDGRLDTETHTCNQDKPWWNVDLLSTYDIKKIVIWNRVPCCKERLSNADIIIYEDGNEVKKLDTGDMSHKEKIEFAFDSVVRGSQVKIQLRGSTYLHIADVQIFVANSSLDLDCVANKDNFSGVPDFNRRAQTQNSQLIGCFVDQETDDFEHDSTEDQCRAHCTSAFFGLVGTTCKCFAEKPNYRLSIGSCETLTGCSNKMDVYYEDDFSDECNLENSQAVRDQLVQEHNAPYGFDIVTNEFKPSPFLFKNNGCGTNIYTVNTDVSGSNGRVTTTTKTVKEYALKTTENLATSVSASGSTEFGKFLAKKKLTISASYDRVRNEALESTNAQEEESEMFESFGVQRVARIEISNFESHKYFVTFTNEFINMLSTYKKDGYEKHDAEKIFETYGMFALERGMIGGYTEARSTMKKSDLSSLELKESEKKDCWEVALQLSGTTFIGEFETDIGTSGCSEETRKEVEKWLDQYQQEAEWLSYVGGFIVPVPGREKNVFTVTAKEAKLLKSIDMYQDEENLRLRPMTDFLNPAKISPYEFRKHHVTEKDFEEIRFNLESHALEILQNYGGIIDGCECGGVTYLKLDSENFVCDCYDPDPFPASSPTPVPFQNIAILGLASQSCEYSLVPSPASNAVDGRLNTITHTCNQDKPWWKLELPDSYPIEKVVIWNRRECCKERLSNSNVRVLDENGNEVATAHIGDASIKEKFEFKFDSDQPLSGKFIEVKLEGTNYLHLVEVEVWSSFQFREALPTMPLRDIARRGKATQSCEWTRGGLEAWRAIDNTKDFTMAHTCQEDNPWWKLDLYDEYQIETIVIHNRLDCCQDRMIGATVDIFDSNGNNVATRTLDNAKEKYELDFDYFDYVKGQKIKITSAKTNNILNFAEIEVDARYPALEEGEGWTSRTGEGNAMQVTCGVGQAVGGVKCIGGHCELIRVLCLNTGLTKISGSEYWTEYFSEEQGTKICEHMVTGIECDGHRCDNIRLRCAKFGGFNHSNCFLTDLFYSEELGGLYETPENAYLVGIHCQGDFCDNKKYNVCFK